MTVLVAVLKVKFRFGQRYIEITHDPFLFSIAQGIFWLSPRETLTQYITFNRGG